jgi:hypothetical protein
VKDDLDYIKVAPDSGSSPGRAKRAQGDEGQGHLRLGAELWGVNIAETSQHRLPYLLTPLASYSLLLFVILSLHRYLDFASVTIKQPNPQQG